LILPEQHREHFGAVVVVLQTLLVDHYKFPKKAAWDMHQHKKLWSAF
jgi:hypothetical protein